MKSFLSRLGLVLAALIPAIAEAQTYTNLYSFSQATGSPATNSDGATPFCSLVLSGNIFYGTTLAGGTNGQGVVFAVHTDGTQFTNLHSFSALTNDTNADGATPYNTLVLSSNMLYGTTYSGGAGGLGTVFRLNTDGTAFTNLHNFADAGGSPRGALTLSGNVLYGTTYLGGTGFGSVFGINTDGTAFTNLHEFTAMTRDADNPVSGLVVSGGTLFGTTLGSPVGAGAIFALGTNGMGYTNLFNFQTISSQGVTSTNKTGGQPSATLLLLGNTLYGTAARGGTNGNGILFAISTNGSGFTNLHTFAMGARNGSNVYTNADGIEPLGTLLFSGTNLFGTASGGGTSGNGTVFSINTNGSTFTTVYSFPPIINGASLNVGGVNPSASLLLANGTLYGTTTNGGGHDGNIFGLVFGSSGSVSLSIQDIAGNIVLSWPNSAFSLQSATNLVGTYTNIPGATSPYTNPATAPHQFFRLQGN